MFHFVHTNSAKITQDVIKIMRVETPGQILNTADEFGYVQVRKSTHNAQH